MLLEIIWCIHYDQDIWSFQTAYSAILCKVALSQYYKTNHYFKCSFFVWKLSSFRRRECKASVMALFFMPNNLFKGHYILVMY